MPDELELDADFIFKMFLEACIVAQGIERDFRLVPKDDPHYLAYGSYLNGVNDILTFIMTGKFPADG